MHLGAYARHPLAVQGNAPEAGGLGLSAKAVQVRLGHSTITMTLDVYGHLFPSGDDGAKLAAAEAALLA